MAHTFLFGKKLIRVTLRHETVEIDVGYAQKAFQVAYYCDVTR